MGTTEAPGVKECSRCHAVKPLDEFYLRKDSKDGRGGMCRPCLCKTKNRWVRENIDTFKPGQSLSAAKRRAKKLGLPFDLTMDTLPPVPDTCPVFGTPLSWGGGTTKDSPSLDRIIPELGYVPGNVEWISYRANMMKADGTPEEVMAVALWLQRRTQEYWDG